MTQFVLVHESKPYRDFEPENDLQINGYTRITFDDENHTAWAHLVDSTIGHPAGDHGETESLTWNEALELISDKNPNDKGMCSVCRRPQLNGYHTHPCE
jgi:hypothetical protein